jgi:hypothetical protein
MFVRDRLFQMELREQPTQPTLAQKLGNVTHVSPLLRKVTKLSGLNQERLGEWLLKCAVERGASHYEREFPSDLPGDNSAMSNEELGVALCLGHLRWDAMDIRASAQLLSAPDIDCFKLARLAEMERVELVFLHIAEAAASAAPEQEPWALLREHLRGRGKIRTEALPHWSRFVSQTGVTEFGGPPRIDWLRRAKPTA